MDSDSSDYFEQYEKYLKKIGFPEKTVTLFRPSQKQAKADNNFDIFIPNCMIEEESIKQNPLEYFEYQDKQEFANQTDQQTNMQLSEEPVKIKFMKEEQELIKVENQFGQDNQISEVVEIKVDGDTQNYGVINERDHVDVNLQYQEKSNPYDKDPIHQDQQTNPKIDDQGSIKQDQLQYSIKSQIDDQGQIQQDQQKHLERSKVDDQGSINQNQQQHQKKSDCDEGPINLDQQQHSDNFVPKIIQQFNIKLSENDLEQPTNLGHLSDITNIEVIELKDQMIYIKQEDTKVQKISQNDGYQLKVHTDQVKVFDDQNHNINSMNSMISSQDTHSNPYDISKYDQIFKKRINDKESTQVIVITQPILITTVIETNPLQALLNNLFLDISIDPLIKPHKAQKLQQITQISKRQQKKEKQKQKQQK